MRIVLPAAVSALLALASMPAAHAGSPPVVARAYYVVQPDPRLCPSPLCGGYWVSLANHARTRCSDGLLRPRCYVASAIDTRTRQPRVIAANALARAVLGWEDSPDFGRLGQLAVDEVWVPAGPAQAAGGFYRIRDTGKRCVRAPCFTYRVGRLDAGMHTTLVSQLGLGPARDIPGVTRALRGPEGLLAAGRITRAAGASRLFSATQVYLKR